MSLKLRSLGTMSSAARGILITGGTNATPIVATVTAGHRLKDGDRIAIAGVTTLTAMNGDWTMWCGLGATFAVMLAFRRPMTAILIGMAVAAGLRWLPL